MASCSHYPESTSPLQLSFSPALLSSASPSVGSSASTSASTMPSSTTNSSALSPPVPMVRPSSHSFSMQRPPLPQDIKKSRNSKRLSLMVAPSPGKLEHLASIAAAATVVASSPSFPPSTPSFSSRRHFTSAPLSSLATIQSQSPASSPVATPTTIAPVEESAPVTSSKRQSQLMLDQALPTSRLPLSSSSTANVPPRQRPISAYFADFSAECGTASPYTKEPVCVLPHLYLGAEHNATDVNSLARLGITAVLNVAIEISNASQQQYQVPASPTFLATSSPTSSSSPEKMITVIGGDRIVKTPGGGSIHYKNLSWTHHQRNLLSEFPKAFAFIEDVKSMDGKVLIHCQLGVSRSASLVIAYVMKTLQMKLTDAYEFVKARSSVISPNMSLMYQLAEFGKSLERPPTSASSPRTGGRREDYDDDNYDDLEDGYPYPTDRADLDGDVNMSLAKPERIPASPTTPVRSTTTKRATLVLSRPGAKLTVSRSPLAPVNINAANGIAAIPKTPMTDRFSFSDNMAPSTPMTDRFSNQGVHPLEQHQQFPEGVSMSMDLSPPVPPFAASYRVSSSSASSGSSFATSTTYSRPSSMSSAASSTTPSICGGPSKVAPQPPVSVVVTPMPLTVEEGKELKTQTNTLWTKLPATPTRTHSGMSVSSTSSSTSQKKQSKKATIHALAKVLTRPWSRNGFHSCQNQQQQHSSSLMTDVTPMESNKNDVKATATESGSSEVIFSPRPGSPSSPENNSFGDFCQAMRME